jgi:hypothetical protein
VIDDQQAIVELAVTYGRLVDGGDFAELDQVFAPDATAQLGGDGQNGLDEICARLRSALGIFERWEHHVTDHQVAVTGDLATARCSVTAHHQRPPGQLPAVYTIVGTYEDRLTRTAAGWRIVHRSLVVLRRDG